MYQLLVLLLLQTHLETVILDIFSRMDFNVFYCNLVNILIHFFFFPLLVCWMSLTWLGIGKGGGLEYSTSLPSRILLQSLCPLGDQHSWRTCHLRPWDQGPNHKDQDMQVELWQNRKLTSWWDGLCKRGAERLIRTYLA